MSGDLRLVTDYGALLAELKLRIQGARARALLAVNAERIALYHGIGRELLARRQAEGWGAKALEDELSRGLVEEGDES